MDFLFSKISDLTAFTSSRSDLLIALGSLSLLTFAGTLLLLPVLLVRIPPDYFLETHIPQRKNRRSRILFHIAKNLAGILFLLMGIIMLFIPGQGLLTIMAGLWLMDLPGKRRVEIRMIRNRSVYGAVDLIRKKAGRESLLLPEPKNRPHSPE